MSKGAWPWSPPRPDSDDSPARPWWRSVRTWLGILLSIICLALALQGIQLGDVAATLRAVLPGWLAVGVLLVILSVIGKAIRWRILLSLDLAGLGRANGEAAGQTNPAPSRSPATALSIARLSTIWLAGAALNLTLPAPRSGDLARAYLAGEAGSLSKSLVFGTIAAEKLLDLVMLALFFLGLAPFIAFPDELAARQAPVIGMALLLLIAIVVVLWQRHHLLSLTHWLLSRLPVRWSGPLLGSTERAMQGLDSLRYPRKVLLLLLWSVLIWLLAAAVNYVVFLAQGLPASWLESLFVLIVLQAGVAVPSSPGKIGVFQILTRWALGVFGVPPAEGLAYSILLYLAAVVSQMVLGALALAWESWQMRRSAASQRTALRGPS